MYLIAIAWIYVVLMMAVAEAVSSSGSLMGAFITFALYGLLPLSVVLYIFGTPARRRQRLAEEAAQAAASDTPDGSGHAPGDAVAPKREEP